MPAASTSAAVSQPQAAQKRFSTATGMEQSNNISNRTSVKGLFETPLIPPHGGVNGSNTTGKNISNKAVDSSSSRNGVMGREDGPWSISVAENQSESDDLKRESRKKQKNTSNRIYTLYITNPTHNLTLLRSNADIIALDSKIRDSHPSPSTLPALPPLPVPAQFTSRSKILQTISRTLSPGVSRSRTPLNILTSPGLGLNEAASTTPPPTSTSAKDSPVPSAPLTPSSEDLKSSSSDSHAITTRLATYLTSLSNDTAVKKHKSWIRFIKVGPDDLESIRVERRVRKVRSDLAQHVKSSVAPTNTNVGATPSQSDIGEEGLRNVDDDRSLSGQSTSASYRRLDRPDVPSRSTSVAQDRSQREDRETNRKGSNFAGIPEEHEKRSLEEKRNRETRDIGGKKELKQKRHESREAEKVTVEDFDMIRVLGKGCAGKVLLVRHLPTKGLFAMKSIHKRHVLAHQELQHTLTEQAVLKRMAKEVLDPFVVRLWWSFHDKNNLYLVMDFHPGGDLATQLSRWGRLGRDRARFYAAEIVEGVEGLHRAGVIYRDLKPENVLIGSDGHIVLSDFGLSKEFPARGNIGSSTPPASPNRSHSSKDVNQQSAHWLSISEDNRNSAGDRNSSSSIGNVDSFGSKGNRNRWSDVRDITTTFCGTAEYLAPEVIQGAAYSYEVDWWSFGTMLYEMLTGITPFWADTHADMYVRVLHDELVFPDDRVLDQDTKSILRGLLQRNPMLRMKEPRIKKHPYFSMIEWAHVFHKRYIPPYIPPINPLDETDTQNFDETFLDMQPVVNGAEDEAVEGEEEETGDATAVSNNGNKKVITQVQQINNNDSGTALKDNTDVKSLFDGYSFRGRRDSGSIKSSIISAIAPSDEQIAQLAAPIASTPTKPKGVISSEPAAGSTGPPAPVVSPTPITILSSSPTPMIKPTPISPMIKQSALPTAQTESRGMSKEEDEEDDYNAAALAAVAALDLLEREAALAEEMLSSQSQTSASSPPTSTATSQAMRDSIDESVASTTPSTGALSKVRMAANVSASGLEAPIEELNDDDDQVEDEWDLVDTPGAGETVQTEVNGGKGQNLFSRGVIDTYRLLRRQESSRMNSSPSYGSGSINKSFNRLSRRNKSSKRDLRPGTGDTTNVGNESAISLGKSSGNEEYNEIERESQLGAPSPLPSSTAIALAGEVKGSGNSPSLASSEDVASQERGKQRIKKIKRFSSFFENSR